MTNIRKTFFAKCSESTENNRNSIMTTTNTYIKTNKCLCSNRQIKAFYWGLEENFEVCVVPSKNHTSEEYITNYKCKGI